MAIAHVVTRGYGNGTFAGLIRQVVLRGFFDSAVTPVQVEQLPNIALRSATGSHIFQLAGYVTGETSWSIDPAVEAGWAFNTSTGQLTVDTDADGTFGPYTVTAINAAGSTPLNPFTVKVSAATFAGFSTGFPITFRI